jgi:hypothetical protein
MLSRLMVYYWIRLSISQAITRIVKKQRKINAGGKVLE